MINTLTITQNNLTLVMTEEKITFKKNGLTIDMTHEEFHAIFRKLTAEYRRSEADLIDQFNKKFGGEL